MKKVIMSLLLSLTATHALAAPKGQDFNDQTGIITYAQATGVWRTQRFLNTPQGIIVCADEHTLIVDNRKDPKTNNTCQDAKTNNKWQYMHTAIPKGRTFVGWKSVSDRYGYQAIEIYWK